jgi:predicted DCC family thiol-disulfide oxidoreductase YuxK
VRWLQRRVAVVGGVTFVPSQDVADLAGFGLTPGDVAAASYWIDEEGRPHRGHLSFTKVLRRGGPAWRIVARVLELPGLSTLAGWAYALVARNRHRLPAPG